MALVLLIHRAMRRTPSSLRPLCRVTPLLFLLFGACVSELGDLSTGAGESDDLTEEARRINDYIAGLDALATDDVGIEESTPSEPFEDGDYRCTTQNYRETRQHDKIVAFAANSESLWPGAIVGAKSVHSGLFTQLVFDRSPLNYSVSLVNLQGSKTATMETPELSEFRDSLGEVLEVEARGATPANIYSEIEEIHSQRQFELAVGVSASQYGSSLSASYNFSDTNIRSRYLVKYVQAYYTVDVDQPRYPSDLLGRNVTLDQVQEKITPGNPPVYVSSITYGRQVMFTFESKYSAQEVGAALEFAYRGTVNVSGDVSLTYEEILSNSKITAYIIGGSGAEAAQAIDDYEALVDFIHSGGDYSNESPGAPIAYKLAYLRDNEPARFSFTDDYEVQECERVSQRILATLRNIRVIVADDAGDDLEVFGSIVAGSTGQPNTIMFNRGDSQYVTIHENSFWPTTGNIAEAILHVSPQPGNKITLNANLTDEDDFFNGGNDHLGNVTVEVPFETGWRREVTTRLTGDGANVEVTFLLQPI